MGREYILLLSSASSLYYELIFQASYCGGVWCSKRYATNFHSLISVLIAFVLLCSPALLTLLPYLPQIFNFSRCSSALTPKPSETTSCHWCPQGHTDCHVPGPQWSLHSSAIRLLSQTGAAPSSAGCHLGVCLLVLLSAWRAFLVSLSISSLNIFIPICSNTKCISVF